MIHLFVPSHVRCLVEPMRQSVESAGESRLGLRLAVLARRPDGGIPHVDRGGWLGRESNLDQKGREGSGFA